MQNQDVHRAPVRKQKLPEAMVHGYVVGDLAIAIAYAILDKPQPLATAAEIVKGYYSAFALTEDEIDALYGFVTLRLCMRVCIGAEQQKNQPDNEYLGISQQPIRNTLPKLMKIHPRFAEAAFREACGLAPFASSPNIVNWAKKNAKSFSQSCRWICAPNLWSFLI